METYIVTLQPKGSHLGQITSQTLFGATCWALQTLGLTDVGALLAGFAESPRFAFSSAFPFIRGPNGVLVRLFPRPAFLTVQGVEELAGEKKDREKRKGQFKKEVKALTDEAKRIKDVPFVSQGLFAEICAGKRGGFSLLRDWGSGIQEFSSALWLKEEIQQLGDLSSESPKKRLWAQMDVQRNSIDRLIGATGEGLLFHEAQTFYDAAHAGLWFAVQADSAVWPWLEAALRYLADTGLGGKRALGKGHFDITWQKADGLLPDVPDADSFITLSHYLPRFNDGQFEAEPRAYKLLAVRQKVENRYPGKGQMRIYSGALNVFAEGSVFALSARQATYGRLEKLAEIDGRSVYYNGLAFPVFARIGGAR